MNIAPPSVAPMDDSDTSDEDPPPSPPKSRTPKPFPKSKDNVRDQKKKTMIKKGELPKRPRPSMVWYDTGNVLDPQVYSAARMTSEALRS